MTGKPDYVKKKFGPMLQKSLKNALVRRIQKEFPRFGGERLVGVCADMILEVLQAHLHHRESVQHGQVLWMAISVDDPPKRGKRIADTELVPVVLDLSIPEDVQDILDRKSKPVRIRHKAVRLCQQAYAQGGLLSNCDLAELLNQGESQIAKLLTDVERETHQLVPRRATIHDVGSGLTHKRIICLKYYKDGKLADQVARETYHTLESVDRYLGQYNRIRYCYQQGMSLEQTAFTMNCSISLVKEYLAIHQELEKERSKSKGQNGDESNATISKM